MVAENLSSSRCGAPNNNAAFPALLNGDFVDQAVLNVDPTDANYYHFLAMKRVKDSGISLPGGWIRNPNAYATEGEAPYIHKDGRKSWRNPALKQIREAMDRAYLEICNNNTQGDGASSSSPEQQQEQQVLFWERYPRMVRSGIPLIAMEQAARRHGVDPALLNTPQFQEERRFWRRHYLLIKSGQPYLAVAQANERVGPRCRNDDQYSIPQDDNEESCDSTDSSLIDSQLRYPQEGEGVAEQEASISETIMQDALSTTDPLDQRVLGLGDDCPTKKFFDDKDDEENVEMVPAIPLHDHYYEDDYNSIGTTTNTTTQAAEIVQAQIPAEEEEGHIEEETVVAWQDTPRAVIVTMQVPGFCLDDLQVTFCNGLLTVLGCRLLENGHKLKFQEELVLASACYNTSTIQATFSSEDDVLTLIIPKMTQIVPEIRIIPILPVMDTATAASGKGGQKVAATSE